MKPPLMVLMFILGLFAGAIIDRIIVNHQLADMIKQLKSLERFYE